MQEGAKVVALDYREEQLSQLSSEYASADYDYVVSDLRNPESAVHSVQEAWDKWGGIDILINNAGIAILEPFTDITYEHWTRIMNVNVNAMFVISQEVGRRWLASQQTGAIVNMASKNGLVGQANLAHYNTSKGGVLLLTQTLAVELAPHGIRVNAVAPGFIDTPMDRKVKESAKGAMRLTLERTPMQRLGTVDEVANAVLFLASDEASYITGTTLLVDGGHLANAGAI